MLTSAAFFLLVAGSGLQIAQASLPLNVSEVTGYSNLGSWKSSTLYRVETDAGYVNNPLLIHLVGSRYDMGYAYGYLLSKEISTNYWSLLHNLLGNNTIDKLLEDLLAQALDWQWNDYLSKELPVVYQRELEGVSDGGKARGCVECGQYVTRALTLANAPGDTQDFLLILVREFLEKVQPSLVSSKAEVLRKMKESLQGRETSDMHCSMFAVWGDRTEGGELFSARNLDWNKDTGLNTYKLIMVTVPDDGSIPSAQLGYASLYGPLAGMSAAGLTVHEANLEEEAISFEGFPWVLRLRYIMELAKDLTTARQLWEATNNTVGFNHMIASGHDSNLYRQGQTTTVAVAMETMYQYTAYFYDNDTREAEALYEPSDGSAAVHIGAPLSEAVWRTNHGYDPKIRAKYEWSQSPSSWSMVRYMMLHDAFQYYNSSETQIGLLQALNLTSTVGDKGHKHPHICMDNTDGTNVLSVTYLPERHILYSAWERGSGDTWRPAVCSNYIKLDLTDWFTPNGPNL